MAVGLVGGGAQLASDNAKRGGRIVYLAHGVGDDALHFSGRRIVPFLTQAVGFSPQLAHQLVNHDLRIVELLCFVARFFNLAKSFPAFRRHRFPPLCLSVLTSRFLARRLLFPCRWLSALVRNSKAV